MAKYMKQCPTSLVIRECKLEPQCFIISYPLRMTVTVIIIIAKKNRKDQVLERMWRNKPSNITAGNVK